MAPPIFSNFSVILFSFSFEPFPIFLSDTKKNNGRLLYKFFFAMTKNLLSSNPRKKFSPTNLKTQNSIALKDEFLPLASTGWVQLTLSSLCSKQCRAINKFQQHHWNVEKLKPGLQNEKQECHLSAMQLPLIICFSLWRCSI